jgi:hypothetical protein
MENEKVTFKLEATLVNIINNKYKYKSQSKAYSRSQFSLVPH